MIKVRVRVLGLGLIVGLRLGLIIPTSRKSRTASYLAMRHIWHDTSKERTEPIKMADLSGPRNHALYKTAGRHLVNTTEQYVFGSITIQSYSYLFAQQLNC